MKKLIAQGDILLEQTRDVCISGQIIPSKDDGAIIIAEGELEGHSHAFYGGNVTFFRDPALAADMLDELYLGHVKIENDQAVLEHEEHEPISLSRGTYRVSRQREFDRDMARLVRD